MGNAEKHPSGRDVIRITDSDSHRTGSEASIRITGRDSDGLASQTSASLGARHTVDGPLTLRVEADSSSQLENTGEAPAAPDRVNAGLVPRQPQPYAEENAAGTDRQRIRIWKCSKSYNAKKCYHQMRLRARNAPKSKSGLVANG